MPELSNIEKARMKWKATPAFLRKRVDRHIVKKKISMPPGFENNIVKARQKWSSMSSNERQAKKIEKQVKHLKHHVIDKINEQEEAKQMRAILKEWKKEHPEE